MKIDEEADKLARKLNAIGATPFGELQKCLVRAFACRAYNAGLTKAAEVCERQADESDQYMREHRGYGSEIVAPAKRECADAVRRELLPEEKPSC